jgi:hypothetical protein
LPQGLLLVLVLLSWMQQTGPSRRQLLQPLLPLRLRPLQGYLPQPHPLAAVQQPLLLLLLKRQQAWWVAGQICCRGQTRLVGSSC